MGQIFNLRPIGNRPVNEFGITYWPITNRPQVTNVTNLPHRFLVNEPAPGLALIIAENNSEAIGNACNRPPIGIAKGVPY